MASVGNWDGVQAEYQETMTTPNLTPSEPSRDPLHGVTLERMLHDLVDHFGWEVLSQRIRIRCFSSDPSIASSLKFLRKTPWAREQVESLYRFLLREQARQSRQS